MPNLCAACVSIRLRPQTYWRCSNPCGRRMRPVPACYGATSRRCLIRPRSVDRAGDNPAAWAGHLEHLLPQRQRLTRGHDAAMPFADVPAFVAVLRPQTALAARALEFTSLTAARTSETLKARWDEFDLTQEVWTVSAQRMKVGKEHRVPLSSAVRSQHVRRALTLEWRGSVLNTPLLDAPLVTSISSAFVDVCWCSTTLIHACLMNGWRNFFRTSIWSALTR